jgi:hypothetical protein
MALSLSSGHLHSAMQAASRTHGRARAALDKMHGVTRSVVRTAEVGGAAFGFGLLQGRLPESKQKVMGVDIGLGSAVMLHVLGFAGIGGDYAGHLHAAGDGALASFLTKQGILYGARMAKDAALKKGQAQPTFGPGSRVSGDDGLEGQGLSDDELADLSRNR